MQGKNVKFHTTSQRSCWVCDNHYDFYEVPKKNKEGNPEGEFFFIAHNTDYDYWICGQMSYTINKQESVRRSILVDRAEFLPYGTYNIVVNGADHNIEKTRLGKNTDYGFKHPDGLFDALGARKRAYRTTAAKILGKVLGIEQNMKSLKGGDAVKIYKNKKKKNNKKY